MAQLTPAMGLLLVKSSAKSIDAGVTVHGERARVVSDSVPVEEDQDVRSRELGECGAHDGFHGGHERKFDSF